MDWDKKARHPAAQYDTTMLRRVLGCLALCVAATGCSGGGSAFGAKLVSSEGSTIAKVSYIAPSCASYHSASKYIFSGDVTGGAIVLEMKSRTDGIPPDTTVQVWSHGGTRDRGNLTRGDLEKRTRSQVCAGGQYCITTIVPLGIIVGEDLTVDVTLYKKRQRLFFKVDPTRPCT